MKMNIHEVVHKVLLNYSIVVCIHSISIYGDSWCVVLGTKVKHLTKTICTLLHRVHREVDKMQVRK